MFTAVTINKTSDLNRLDQWLSSAFIYRGQDNASFQLTSKIERSLSKLPSEVQSNLKRDLPNVLNLLEHFMLDDFKRRAHHYYQHIPSYDNDIEWLSLLQHHGGPTRLLDFTTCLNIALFFAIESTIIDASIWCINRLNIMYHMGQTRNELGMKISSESPLTISSNTLLNAVNKLIKNKNNKSITVHIEPFKLNERMSIQQGTFLCSCDLTKTFEENLCKTLGLSFKQLSTQKKSINIDSLLNKNLMDVNILKINIPQKFYYEMISNLNKNNINAATLFPGLDGFARSMNHYTRLDYFNDEYK